MSESSPSVTRGFWIVGAVFLLWNLLGLASFFMQISMTEETLAGLPDAERALYENLPSWVNVAFGIATVGGTLGCVLLLMRKALAFPVFIASLLGVLAQNTYSFFMSNVLEVYGPGSAILPSLVILGSIFLVFYSRNAQSKGWIA